MNQFHDRLPPMVVVHDLADARLVLSVAGGRPVGLLSAADAGSFLGPAWWRALITALQSPLLVDVLDCGNQAGRAIEAIRLRQRRLVVGPDCPQLPTLQLRARPLGAILLHTRPNALDLSQRSAHRRLAEWLAGTDHLG